MAEAQQIVFDAPAFLAEAGQGGSVVSLICLAERVV
jgi:hypothetical protein